MENNGQILLTEQSKEELIEIILKQREQIKELERKLQKDEEAKARKNFLKAQRLLQKKKRRKRPGQKEGHLGLTRIKPTDFDRIIEQKLKICPDCNHRLSQSQEVTRHIQEDIVPARREVTCFKKHRYYCKHCKKMVTAPHAPEEVPHGYVGPNVLVQAVILKYHQGLPFNKIKELLENLCQFPISEGALSQSLQRMREWLKVEVEQILDAIRSSPHIYVDETGWKINGTNHWLWAFVNERLAYYQIARSRGSKVPKSVLPDDYGGILVSDFYAAYNRLPGKKQKCLVHLMREMHACYQKDQSKEFLIYHKKLKRIIKDSMRLYEAKSAARPEIYEKRIKRLEKRLFLWSCGDYKNKNLKRLSKRFLKHWLHLLTFLKQQGVSFNNNLAERMIRPHVILRNRSFQNRSEKGARAHETMMSLLHTARLQKRDAVDFFKQAFLTHRQGNLIPILSC